MLERRSESDVQTDCNACHCVIYVPSNEWNRRQRKGTLRFYCSRSCSGTKGIQSTYISVNCPKCDTIFTRSSKGYEQKFCSRKCANSKDRPAEVKEKIRLSCREVARLNPESYLKGVRASLSSHSSRFSSKAERALAEALTPLGFRRHKQVTVEDLTFDVDIVSLDGTTWIESDGEWHFRQVHEGHDYQKTRLRDDVEEREALHRNVLLIRVNNQTTSIEEQVAFVLACRSSWDGKGCVKRLGYENVFKKELSQG